MDVFFHSREGAIAGLRFAIPSTGPADCEKKNGAEVTADEQDARSTARRAMRARDGEARHLPGEDCNCFYGWPKGGAFDADDLRAQRIAAAAKRLNEPGEASLNHRTWW